MKNFLVACIALFLISGIVNAQKVTKRNKTEENRTLVDSSSSKKFEDSLLGRKIEIFTESQLIPSSYFDKYILSDIQRYIVLNSETSTYPAFSLDALEKNISFTYSRLLGKPKPEITEGEKSLGKTESKGFKRYSTFSAKLTAEYDANGKSAAVYSSGAFVNNINLNLSYSRFANGKANYDSSRPREIFLKKLKDYLATGRKNSEKFESYKQRLKDLEKTDGNWDEKLWLTKQIEKKWDSTSLHAELDTFLLTKAPFYRRKLSWLTVGLNEIGKPSYKTFDINAKDDERFDDKRIFVIHPTVSYSWLRVKNKKVKDISAFKNGELPIQDKKDETIFFFSIGGGLQLSSNIGQNSIKATDYIVEDTVFSGNGTTIFTEDKYKAYKKGELADMWRATLTEELLWLFIPKVKMGISQRFEYYKPFGDNKDLYKDQISHSLGWVLPIQNKKEKVTALMQVYWKCSGFIKTEFINEFGLKLGVPINIPID